MKCMIVDSLSNDNILDLTKLKAFIDKTETEIMSFVLTEQKTFWEMEKMLVTSIFSFSKCGIKSPLSLTVIQLRSCGKRLIQVESFHLYA